MSPPTAEDLLAIHLEELGIEFRRQYEYAAPRKFRADFAIPSHRLLIEVQGGIFSKQAHGSISGVLRDNERVNNATLRGWRILRVTPDEVMDGRAKSLVEAALRSTTVMEES